jgi:general secretion pathway protein D
MRFILLSILLWWGGVLIAEAREQPLRERVRATVIPIVQYRDLGADDAFEQLSAFSRAADPEGAGVNIVYRGPQGDAAPRITLSLRRVSLYDAIRYITQVAGLHYRLDENAVIISDQPFRPDRIVTRIYPVQPTFMDLIRAGQEEEEPPRRDPFFW